MMVPMLLLVRIDLRGADLAAFEAYETRVLALLPRHGGRLLERLRTGDGAMETHLLSFPDAAAFDAFRASPERQALQPGWEACGARSTVEAVERV